MSSTRSIHLAQGIERDGAQNEGTIVADIPGLRMRSGETGRFFLADVPESSFEELYRTHFEALAAAHVRHANEPGVLVAAVVPGFGLRGHVWLAAGPTLRAAIVGRHERVDLFLPEDPSFSLRHLAVLVRRDGPAGVRVRVLDLRTGVGFRDEADRDLAAVSANGPLFLRASAHRFFLLPTGHAPLPPWEGLPPRLFQPSQAKDLPHAVSRAPFAAPFSRDEPTIVTAGVPLAPPEFRELLAPGESPLGHLHVRNLGRTTVLSLGETRASRGLLLGRYGRCDGLPQGWLPSDVSRVHAFLLCEGGVLHIVDAGSTNGTSLRGRVIRCEPMPAGERVSFGSASLQWAPAN